MAFLVLALDVVAFSAVAAGQNESGLDSLVRNYHTSYRESAASGKYADALRYLKLYDRFNDSIETRRRQAERKIIESRYDNEKKTKQLNLLRKQEEINRLRLTQSRITLYAFIAAIILVPLLLLLVFRQLRLKSSTQALKLEQTLLLSRMNPHFIFNTMANIQALIVRKEADLSLKYLEGFSGLVSNILERSGEETISLEKEEEIITDYLEMQKLRFGDKFEYSISFGEDLDKMNVMIPPMLSQPFIENALDHGIRYKEGPGFLQVRLGKDDGRLVIEIEDDGVGRLAAKEKDSLHGQQHHGMTIAITHERLKTMSNRRNERGKLEITDLVNEDGTGRGTVVRIELRI
jgi:LytS/YehU family sensor histidine kinase